MELNFAVILIIVIIIWLSVVSFFLWNALSHYNKLTKGLTDKTFQSVLENIIKDINKSKKDIDFLKDYCDRIGKDGLTHIQKIGLLRFNPFKDTGGDQSFILSLVDSADNGVIISGLHSRTGTRWYAKKIVNGKALEHELSEEEKAALRMANRSNKN